MPARRQPALAENGIFPPPLPPPLPPPSPPPLPPPPFHHPLLRIGKSPACPGWVAVQPLRAGRQTCPEIPRRTGQAGVFSTRDACHSGRGRVRRRWLERPYPDPCPDLSKCGHVFGLLFCNAVQNQKLACLAGISIQNVDGRIGSCSVPCPHILRVQHGTGQIQTAPEPVAGSKHENAVLRVCVEQARCRPPPPQPIWHDVPGGKILSDKTVAVYGKMQRVESLPARWNTTRPYAESAYSE